MDILFLDTSIWESNNFLESKRIKQLLKLCEAGEIRMILPELTYDEILNRIRKNCEDACAKVKKLRNDARILRNIPELRERYTELNVDETTERLQGIFTQTLSGSGVEIVDYPMVNIKDVFNSYFGKQFPFGSAGKKSEFPDAFALVSAENWAINEGEQLITFAKDGDFLGYVSDELIIHESFEDYINDKLKEIDEANFALLEESLDDNRVALIAEIDDWVRDQLDDYSKYYDVSNYLEVHEIDVQNIETELSEISITSIGESYITFQAEAYVEFEVAVIIDDENYMAKDEDTKTWFSYEKREEVVKRNKVINVEMRYEKLPLDEGYGEINIEILNQDKELNI